VPQSNRIRRTFALTAMLAAVAFGTVPRALAVDAPDVVRTQTGLVHGALTDVLAFKGIPYAAPPVGPLRWRAPQAPAAWNGVREATSFGPACMQPGAAYTKSEDCLTLNVWAPRDAHSRPVMVWFHGGGLVVGCSCDAALDGAALARRGVVVVTLNYRLGIFGFLAHPGLSAESPQHVSGNYGLRDQVAALRWVKENIAAFGGDPQRVTIFGQSSGAEAVAELLIVPAARGLAARAIMESAPIMRPSRLEFSLAQAEQDGLHYGDLATLRADSPAALLALVPPVDPETRAATARGLHPVRDGVILPNDEYTAYTTEQVAPIPVIIGNNTDEASFYLRNVPVKTLAAYRPYLEARFGAQAAEAERLYPATDDASANHAQAQIASDTSVMWGVRELARQMSKVAPVYKYVFSHATNGVAPMHTSEIPYVFGNEVDGTNNKTRAFTAGDRAVSDAMQSAWINFATTGNPNGAGVPIAWPRFDAQTQRYLEFGDQPAIGADWHAAQLDFLGRTLRQI
jgi:para-nitrobenzyl esterase